MRHRFLALPCLVSALAAQSPTNEPQSQPAEPKALTGSLGMEVTTAYFFRGILQENQGLIAEPHLELAWRLLDAHGSLRNLDFAIGQWNSLHGGPTGSGGPAGQSMWYESDFYAGLRAGLGERWTAGVTYTSLVSPNDRFRTVQEVACSLGFDDSELLGKGFGGLQPSVTVAKEFHGQADAGSELGTYLQLGVAPAFAVGKAGEVDFTLTLPVIAAFSLQDYYQDATGDDHTFGYLDLGAVLGCPLTFLPARFGPWRASLGVHLMLLGDSNEQLNANHDTAVVGVFGLSTTF